MNQLILTVILSTLLTIDLAYSKAQHLSGDEKARKGVTVIKRGETKTIKPTKKMIPSLYMQNGKLNCNAARIRIFKVHDDQLQIKDEHSRSLRKLEKDYTQAMANFTILNGLKEIKNEYKGFFAGLRRGLFKSDFHLTKDSLKINRGMNAIKRVYALHQFMTDLKLKKIKINLANVNWKRYSIETNPDTKQLHELKAMIKGFASAYKNSGKKNPDDYINLLEEGISIDNLRNQYQEAEQLKTQFSLKDMILPDSPGGKKIRDLSNLMSAAEAITTNDVLDLALNEQGVDTGSYIPKEQMEELKRNRAAYAGKLNSIEKRIISRFQLQQSKYDYYNKSNSPGDSFSARRIKEAFKDQPQNIQKCAEKTFKQIGKKGRGRLNRENLHTCIQILSKPHAEAALNEALQKAEQEVRNLSDRIKRVKDLNAYQDLELVKLALKDDIKKQCNGGLGPNAFIIDCDHYDGGQKGAVSKLVDSFRGAGAKLNDQNFRNNARWKDVKKDLYKVCSDPEYLKSNPNTRELCRETQDTRKLEKLFNTHFSKRLGNTFYYAPKPRWTDYIAEAAKMAIEKVPQIFNYKLQLENQSWYLGKMALYEQQRRLWYERYMDTLKAVYGDDYNLMGGGYGYPNFYDPYAAMEFNGNNPWLYGVPRPVDYYTPGIDNPALLNPVNLVPASGLPGFQF